ncbi:hypothetical protein LPJ69_004998 [Coemansia sp. RSA 1752]|nr:hypothetical protein LPJ69_004998 [Coemansia sp. RSA 1752]KAJ2270369.1 hypothetical protein J3F81_003919 [Coemansia sp. RSA 371]
MKLDYQSIVNGSAVHRLKDSWVQFPNARFLEIEFQHTEHKAENASNVTMFIPIMQHMLPAITKVYMTVSETKGHAQCVYDTSLQKLLEHVCLGRQWVSMEATSVKQTHTIEHLVPANSLTRLFCQWKHDNHQLVAQAIRANATSLQYLVIFIFSPTNISSIILDPTNRASIFPNLSILSLSKLCNEELETVPCIPDVVPFPRLTALEMGFTCPFSDDVLLRGNHGTLNELIIRLDYRTMHILSTYQSTLRGPSRLSYLVIVKTDLEISKQYAHTIHTFMSNIIPQLKKLFINGQNILEHLLDLLTHNPVYYKLQRLVMFSCEIPLVQLATLLQKIPTLKRLTCDVTSLGHEASGMGLAPLIRSLHAQLKPLKLHLGEWTIACGRAVSVDITALSIILLASTCPHLKSVYYPVQSEDESLKVFSRVCMLQQSGEFRDLVDSNMYFSLTTISPYSVIRISTSVFNLNLPKLY